MKQNDLLFNKRYRRRSLLTTVLTAAVLALTGCSEAQATNTDVMETQQITETTLLKSNKIEIMPDTVNSSETVLPENMTMDDLRNILVVNGKTLTLPTSINKLMEMDENFSYKAEYADEKSPLYNANQTGFYVDIFYKGVLLTSVGFPTDKNDVSSILDDDMVCSLFFSKTHCEETDMQVGLSCNLGFGSSLDEVEKIFGEPNVFTVDTTNKDYEFYDKDYKCKLSFEINSYNDNLVSWFSIGILPLSKENKDE